MKFRQKLQKVIQIHFARALSLPRFAADNGLDQISNLLFCILWMTSSLHSIIIIIVLQGRGRLAVLVEKSEDGFGGEYGT